MTERSVKTKSDKSEWSIRDEIRRTTILGGMLGFLIVLLVVLLAIVPFLWNRAATAATQTNKDILETFNNATSNATDFTRSIVLPASINPAIRSFFEEPSQTKEAHAEITLDFLRSSASDIRSVLITANGHTLIGGEERLTEEDYITLSGKWYTDFPKDRSAQASSPVYTVQTSSGPEYSIARARTILNQNQYYTVVVIISLNKILDTVSAAADDTLDAFLLADSYGNSFYEQGEELPRSVTEKMLSADENVHRQNYHFGVLFSDGSRANGFRIISLVTGRRIFFALAPYILLFFLGMSGVILLLLILLSARMNSIIRPVTALAKHMDTAVREDTLQPVAVDRQNEIGLLQESFNKMIRDLQNAMLSLSEKEKEEQQARFRLLISQIDPHFIYNTINSINYMARAGRTEDIVKVNTALIAILRDRLRVNNIEFTDSVAREMEVIEHYVTIERYMYGESLTLKWDAADELLNEQIPKNMIQPLVENSIFHGLIDEESGELNGTITISVRKNEKGIEISVTDDGSGMSKEELGQIRSDVYRPEMRGEGIGLTNIRGRLYYLYGRTDGLRIESTPGGGTTVTIELY